MEVVYRARYGEQNLLAEVHDQERRNRNAVSRHSIGVRPTAMISIAAHVLVLVI
jgi:hypothetical protein